MKFDVRMDEPLVSVCLITYNHEAYIRACLDGILMQETDFPFELVIGEDESTDATRNICLEYAEKRPDRIRLILRSQLDFGRNAYQSQGVYNYIETTKVCHGKYVALCDGDDAWTDPLKLQKQVDIMEADPGISLIHSGYDKVDELSGCRIKNANRGKIKNYSHTNDQSRFIFDIIQRNYPIAASTAFLRTRDVLEIFENGAELFRTCPMGDITTWCELTNYGSIYYQDESSILYRILAESDSNSLSAEKKFRFVNGASDLGLMIAGKYKLPLQTLRQIKVKNSNRCALMTGCRSEIEGLYRDEAYPFSLFERLFYYAGSLAGLRTLTKWVFQLRYRINCRLFNTTRFS